MLSYENMMRRCLQLAQLGEAYVAPNPMVGALLATEDGRIVAEGWHQQFGGPHAEVNAFRNLGDEVSPHDITLFVSLEPCSHFGKTPPCADLIISKGVKRVVVGTLDPNPQVSGQGVKRLTDNGIEVITGVLEAECRALNKRFLCLHEQHRPYVILKWAQTADGYIDVLRDGGNPIVISNPVTKAIVHKMRAENMAIMVGTNTVLRDNPKLLTTHWSGRNPIRITFDRHNRLPSTANIFSSDAETIVYRDRTDWNFVLQDMAARGIHSVLVEGGATLLNHIISTGIYDEVHIEVNQSLYIREGIKAPEIPLNNKVTILYS